jgi:Fur family transcriptional regulator, peroxide stress response regulator
MNVNRLKDKLREKGLKVTPRRLLILDAILKLDTHPTAEEIIKFIRKRNPKIATATVYKALNILVSKKVISKVETEIDITRYDATTESHHHLYCSESERIVDFVDTGLNEMIKHYFEKEKIPGFIIEDVKLQIIGKFEKVNK